MLSTREVKEYAQAIVDGVRDIVADIIPQSPEDMIEESCGFSTLWESREEIYDVEQDSDNPLLFTVDAESAAYEFRFNDDGELEYCEEEGIDLDVDEDDDLDDTSEE